MKCIVQLRPLRFMTARTYSTTWWPLLTNLGQTDGVKRAIVGEWESGRVGEWESRRVGERESEWFGSR